MCIRKGKGPARGEELEEENTQEHDKEEETAA